MAVNMGSGGVRRTLADPKVYIGGQRRDGQEIYAYSGGQRRLVWTRSLTSITPVTVNWEIIDLYLAPPGGGADSYTLKRDGVVIYSGAATYFRDAGRLPGTTYGYTVEAIRSSAVVGTASTTAATSARRDLGLVANPASHTSINLSWADPDQGTIDNYRLYRWTGVWSIIYNGPSKGYTDVGLAASTGYSYLLETYRAGVLISPNDQVVATTSARPTLQKTITLTMNAGASYQGDGDKRTDADGLAHLYTGYYSSNQGQQKSLWTFAIPADLRNCKSVDRVRVSIYCEHAFSGTTKSQLVTHHGSTSGAKFPGSTGKVAGPTTHPRPGWWSGAQWVDITNHAASGRPSTKEEFRVNGATGFGLISDSAQNNYGYARRDAKVEFIYTIYTA